MGNQAGKDGSSQYGGIFVKLDKDVYNPGDTLSGNIYLDIRANYPGDKLCLEVKGKEFAKWIDREYRQRPKPGGQPGEMESYHVDIPREAERKIIENNLTVYDWNARQIIRPGQYTFPFAFQIPNGLPGSFYFQRGNAAAEIKYSVEGYLKPEVESVPKMKHKVPVTMREKPQQNIQTKEISVSKKLSTWCCVDAGTINMRTAFEKNAYAPGEEARILAEIDNSKCSLNITHITFQLTQNIRLNANGHGKSFGFAIRTVNLGSIGPGQACVGAQRKEASIILPPGQEGNAKYFGSEHMGNDPDPTQIITPSTHGKLIQSDFSLSLSCAVDGCVCCDSMPVNNMPIQVYSAVQARQPDPIPPPGWNPTPMPAANLTISIVQLANGGQEIHIDTGAQGGAPNMMGNQMPPQQGFGQPNQQAQPQMQPAKPMDYGNPNQFNTSQQQPLMNNSMNTSMPQQQPYPQQQQQYPQQQPYPQQQQGYPQQQPYPQQQQQQGYPQQQPYNGAPQYGQPQVLNPQPVQIGQNNGQYH